MAWEIVAEPHGDNPGKIAKAKAAVTGKSENTGGIIIYLSDGTTKTEVSRVAYIRRTGVCKNPDTDFTDQLAIEVAKAREAAKVLNELTGSAGELS